MAEVDRSARPRLAPRHPDARPEAPYDPDGALGDVGSALTVALAVLVVAAQGLGALGIPLLRPGVAGALTLLGFVATAVAAWGGLRRGRRGLSPQPSPGRRHLALAAAPFVLMCIYLAASRALPVGRRTEWYLGGDHVRHLIMTAGEQADGFLTYAAQPYPRAWHTLLAAVWSAADLTPRQQFVEVADLSAALVWMASALLTLTTAALAATWARRCGSGPRGAGVAGFLAGTATLLPSFLGNYQGLGLETSVVGACVLAVVLRTQLVGPASVRSLVVAAAGVVVLAHTWQLLLPVVGLAALRSGLAVARRHGARGWSFVVALAALVTWASAPSFLAVATQVGVEHATDAGVVVPVPWVFLGAGVGAMLLLAVRRPTNRADLRWVALLVLVPAVTGVALAAYVGVTPSTYYPSKLIWHTALLGLAPLAVVTTRGARHALGAPTAVRGAAAAVAGLAVAYALAQPLAAYAGVWSSVDGPATLRVLTTPGVGQAQVVWTGAPRGTDTLARVLLDAVRPDPGPTRTPQKLLTVPEECALLAEAADPTVASDQPADRVRARYACVPDVRVVAVRPR